MTSSGRLAAGPAPGESLVSALCCAPLRVGAAASSESSCGAEWGTQVTPMNVSSALASADTGSRAPSRGGGPRGAAGRGPGRGPGRSGCPPALLRARHLSLLGKRPEAGRQAEQRRVLRARSAPGLCDASSGWPPPRLWFLRTPGHRLAGGGGSGRSVRPGGGGAGRGPGLRDRGAAAPPGGHGAALQAAARLNGTGGKRGGWGRFLRATPGYLPTWDSP